MVRKEDLKLKYPVAERFTTLPTAVAHDALSACVMRPAAGPGAGAPRAGTPERLRVLFVSKWHVVPADTGGKIRTLQVLNELASRHDIHLVYNIPHRRGRAQAPNPHELSPTIRCHPVPTTTPAERDVRYFCKLALNFFHPAPFNAHKDYDPALATTIQRLVRTLHPDVVVCDFVQTALNCLGLRNVPTVLFQHNVEAEIFARQALRAPRRLWRALFRLQARKMLRYERRMLRHFDVVIAISERDKRLFERLYGCDHVYVIDTAVDVDRYRDVRPDYRSRRVLFIGGLDWIPNPHGVTHFCRHIWPIVRRAVPDAEFEIVGRNPSREFASTVAGIPGVRLVGTVPDTRPYLARAAVAVVPLYMGGGTRMKIYEYMAPGLPVVSTSLGCEGLPLRHGEHLLVCDDEEAFARAVVRLLKEPDYAMQIGMRAADFVRRNFSAKTVARQFEGHLLAAIRRFTARTGFTGQFGTVGTNPHTVKTASS